MKKNTLKKQQITKGLLLLTSLFIMTSCNLEKRQHLSGYHVTWKKNKQHEIQKTNNPVTINYQPESNNNNNNNIIIIIVDKIGTKENLEIKNTSPELMQSINPENFQTSVSSNIKNVVKIPVIKYSIKSNIVEKNKLIFDEPLKKDTQKKKIEPFSLLSFISAMLILLIITFFLIPISYSILSSLLVILGEYLILCAVTFGIIGLIRIKRNKDKFKGKPLALIGLTIGGLFLLTRIVRQIVYAFIYF